MQVSEMFSGIIGSLKKPDYKWDTSEMYLLGEELFIGNMKLQHHRSTTTDHHE